MIDDEVARVLVEARTTGRGLHGFPGGVAPADLDRAYRIQDRAIARWPDTIAGWKLGYIAAERRGPGAEERLVGPIWHSQVAHDDATRSTGTPTMPVFADGFAAAEAELVLRIDTDQPEHEGPWTADEADAVATTMFGGIEIASSPIPRINDLGPTVVAADFGNNRGLVVGPKIPDWRGLDLAQIRVATRIDDQVVGESSPDAIPGGVRDALAQALTTLARRGRPLTAGQLLATGALTGIHAAGPGRHVAVTFGDHGTVSCQLS